MNLSSPGSLEAVDHWHNDSIAFAGVLLISSCSISSCSSPPALSPPATAPSPPPSAPSPPVPDRASCSCLTEVVQVVVISDMGGMEGGKLELFRGTKEEGQHLLRWMENGDTLIQGWLKDIGDPNFGD